MLYLDYEVGPKVMHVGQWAPFRFEYNWIVKG